MVEELYTIGEKHRTHRCLRAPVSTRPAARFDVRTAPRLGLLCLTLLALVALIGTRIIWSVADAECRRQEQYIPQYVLGNMSYSFYSVCDQFAWHNEWQVSQWP